MLSVALLLFFAVIKCNASLYHTTAVELPPFSDSRIIGGSPANITQYPFIVQLMSGGQFICGGSLITRQHVLTAAHCVADQYGNVFSPNLFLVRMGTHQLYTGGTVRSVAGIIAHDLYNTPLRDNDVAVMLLASPVTFGPTINSATIPVQDARVPDNGTVITIGWGRTDITSPAASMILNEVSVRKVNLYDCFVRYNNLQILTGDPYYVTSNMFCAGIIGVGGKDACQGDSGGPLIYNNVVVGITSWGYGCAEAEYPGVYARVASYSTWIENAVTRLTNGAFNDRAGALTLFIPILYAILI